ncbi:TetR/AcrR family transcriptional regulator (plasmid) [Aquicoccus sp. G2-2]|uniref:TetR/AcrR family transcriptional regulator n=1 Tax=Aquicoccus sp. G2-2 TaxID=3092120 RepID=UPI002AE088F3|nr:TetR/AcrR family transcriptional regulator [Aquicoccus sp. G2-2]MEA1112090.1 TetR/AcrR family transcriptional regulator [Aquicoccus sp. G2-2]
MAQTYNVDTPDRLLDSAEKLFSKRGYGAVTLSAIAQDAGANVGQIVYHFATKEELFNTCILRRSNVLSRERHTLLTSYTRLVGAKNVAIEPLIRAYVDPFFDKVRGGDEGWHNYSLLLARVVWRENSAGTLAAGFNEVAIEFLKSFRTALPDLSPDAAVRGFQFLLATLYSSVSDDKRIELLTDGASRAADYDAYYRFLIPFLAAGFERIAR